MDDQKNDKDIEMEHFAHECPSEQKCSVDIRKGKPVITFLNNSGYTNAFEYLKSSKAHHCVEEVYHLYWDVNRSKQVDDQFEQNKGLRIFHLFCN